MKAKEEEDRRLEFSIQQEISFTLMDDMRFINTCRSPLWPGYRITHSSESPKYLEHVIKKTYNIQQSAVVGPAIPLSIDSTDLSCNLRSLIIENEWLGLGSRKLPTWYNDCDTHKWLRSLHGYVTTFEHVPPRILEVKPLIANKLPEYIGLCQLFIEQIIAAAEEFNTRMPRILFIHLVHVYIKNFLSDNSSVRRLQYDLADMIRDMHDNMDTISFTRVNLEKAKYSTKSMAYVFSWKVLPTNVVVIREPIVDHQVLRAKQVYLLIPLGEHGDYHVYFADMDSLNVKDIASPRERDKALWFLVTSLMELVSQRFRKLIHNSGEPSLTPTRGLLSMIFSWSFIRHHEMDMILQLLPYCYSTILPPGIPWHRDTFRQVKDFFMNRQNHQQSIREWSQGFLNLMARETGFESNYNDAVWAQDNIYLTG